MLLSIDTGQGELDIEGRARLRHRSTEAEVLAALGPTATREPPGGRFTVRTRASLGSRCFEASFRVSTQGLESIWFVGDDHSEAEHPIERARRDRAFVRDLFGPPGYENARGSIHAYPWGFLYATNGTIALVYPGYRQPVPLPAPNREKWPFFRCMGCGHLMDLGYGSGVLEASRNRGGAPCEACGEVAWVQSGSMTEFYRYSQRPWVCEVGMHPAEGVKAFRLFAPERDVEPGKLAISSILVKACPAHVPDLRRGMLGCVLPEGAEGEDPKGA